MTVSAIEKDGISETWKVISNLVDGVRKKVIFSLIVRNSQSFGFLNVRYQLLSVLDKNPIKEDLLEIAEDVASGKNLALAANQILQEISIKKGELG